MCVVLRIESKDNTLACNSDESFDICNHQDGICFKQQKMR